MIKLKSSLALLSMLLLCLVLAACSSKSGRSAVEPGMQGDSISDVAGMEA